MSDYKELYTFLFDRISDAIILLELGAPEAAKVLLERSKQDAQERSIRE